MGGGWWGKIEIKDQLSPAEAETGAELGNRILKCSTIFCISFKDLGSDILLSTFLVGYPIGHRALNLTLCLYDYVCYRNLSQVFLQQRLFPLTNRFPNFDFLDIPIERGVLKTDNQYNTIQYNTIQFC